MKKIYLITLVLIFLAGSLFSADSVRIRSSLETLFADNTSGEIGAQDLRDFLKSLFVIKDDDTLFWSTDTYIDSASAEELQNWVTKLSNSSSDVDISNLTVSDSANIDTLVVDSISILGNNIEVSDEGEIGISSGELIRFDSAGDIEIMGANVGIETASPSAKLDIESDETTIIKVANENQGEYFSVFQNADDKSGVSFGDIDNLYGTSFKLNVDTETIKAYTPGVIELGDNGFGNNTLLTIDDANSNFTFENGDVGIGTNIPEKDLHSIGQTLIDSVLILEPMDTADVITPAEGMIIWDDSDNKPYGYNGTTWNAMW